MGWAKYTEDNFEAMEERWSARESYSTSSTSICSASRDYSRREATSLYQQKLKVSNTLRTAR